MNDIFVSRLRKLMGKTNESAFSRFLEMHQSTFYLYSHGTRKPSVDFVMRVCRKCNVTSDWLLGLSDACDPIYSSKFCEDQIAKNECKNKIFSVVNEKLRLLELRIEALERRH